MGLPSSGGEQIVDRVGPASFSAVTTLAGIAERSQDSQLSLPGASTSNVDAVGAGPSRPHVADDDSDEVLVVGNGNSNLSWVSGGAPGEDDVLGGGGSEAAATRPVRPGVVKPITSKPPAQNAWAMMQAASRVRKRAADDDVANLTDNPASPPHGQSSAGPGPGVAAAAPSAGPANSTGASVGPGPVGASSGGASSIRRENRGKRRPARLAAASIVQTADAGVVRDEACQTEQSSGDEDRRAVSEHVAWVAERERIQEQFHAELARVREQLVARDGEISRMQQECQEQIGSARKSLDRATKELQEQLMAQAKEERKQAREKVHRNNFRLAMLAPRRNALDGLDSWENGEEFREIDERLQEIRLERSEIEQQRKTNRPRRGTASSRSAKAASSDAPESEGMSADEYAEQEEVYKLRKDQLKKEEAELETQLDRLGALSV
jgi:hypothetical protein